jgi:Cu-Zn family superoxide dismutase
MLVSLLLTQLALGQDTPTATWNAAATLEPRSGSTLTGLVTFSQSMPESGRTGSGGDTLGTDGKAPMADRGVSPTAMPAPVEVSIRLVSATPGNHAVFLHQLGDCSAPDGSSAGDYYSGALPTPPNAPGARPAPIGAPASPAAGAPESSAAPANPPPGYLGFVTVGADGRGAKDLTVNGYTLEPGAASLIGRSIVVYERAPDFTMGEAPGGRQACGVIRARAEAPLGTE